MNPPAGHNWTCSNYGCSLRAVFHYWKFSETTCVAVMFQWELENIYGIFQYIRYISDILCIQMYSTCSIHCILKYSEVLCQHRGSRWWRRRIETMTQVPRPLLVMTMPSYGCWPENPQKMPWFRWKFGGTCLESLKIHGSWWYFHVWFCDLKSV